MIFTMDDIQLLLCKANQTERDELAKTLELELQGVSVEDHAKQIAKQLCWKFQTPLGYAVQTPTFDEICLDIAQRLQLSGLKSKRDTCWDQLAKLNRALLDKMLDEMESGQIEELVRAIVPSDKYAQFIEENPNYLRLGAGVTTLLTKQFGGFITYQVAVIVANGFARVLLGTGLSIAANAALTRTVSVLLGPAGWLLTIWGVNDLMGTSYKTVIPAVWIIYSVYERLKDSGELPFKV